MWPSRFLEGRSEHREDGRSFLEHGDIAPWLQHSGAGGYWPGGFGAAAPPS